MLKIISIALICAFIVSYLRYSKSELYELSLVASSIIILFFSLEYITQTFEFVNKLINIIGVDKEYYKIIFKILIISYLVEFTSSTLEDMGLKSLSNKIVFVGKIVILLISSPIIYAVLNLFSGLL